VKIGIVGVSGYGGSELLRLCAGHPAFEIAYVGGESTAGQALAQRFPALGGHPAGKLVIQPFAPGKIAGVDLLFVSLPSGKSREPLAQVPKDVKIVDVGGELQVDGTSTNVVVDRAGKIVLKVDRGDVTLQRATETVAAYVSGGDVHILDVSGPVNLELERGDGEVSWSSFSGDKDSTLVSSGGNLTVRFPSTGGCRVEAKSKDGRIDSELPTVVVLESGNEAQGPVNSGYRPIVKITASGDVHLLGAAGAP